MQRRGWAARLGASVIGVGGLVAVTAGCSSGAPLASTNERTSASSSAIQNGDDDHTHTFAVGVCGGSPGKCQLFCSGALIAPNLVVTARHCVEHSPSEIDCATAKFGTRYGDPSDFWITTDYSMLQGKSGWHQVKEIRTPAPTPVCGDDVALLMLGENVAPAEATPVTPAVQYPITDHTRYATVETAIGYGLASPAASAESTLGVRRSKSDIGIQCIPGDAKLDCLKQDPTIAKYLSTNEMVVGDGTCEGDSGSSAFEQVTLNAGKPVSLGVLSRGGVDDPQNPTQCLGGIYTRLDAWKDFVVGAGIDAAADGNYPAPDWTIDPASAPAPTAIGTGCAHDADCSSGVCASAPGAAKGAFTCTQACDDAGNACPGGYACTNGLCFGAGGAGNAASGGASSGCSVGGSAGEPGPDPLPWGSIAVAALGIAAVRRRRRSSAA